MRNRGARPGDTRRLTGSAAKGRKLSSAPASAKRKALSYLSDTKRHGQETQAKNHGEKPSIIKNSHRKCVPCTPRPCAGDPVRTRARAGRARAERKNERNSASTHYTRQGLVPSCAHAFAPRLISHAAARLVITTALRCSTASMRARQVHDARAIMAHESLAQ